WDEEKKAWEKKEKKSILSPSILVQHLANVLAPATSGMGAKDKVASDVWNGLREMDRIVNVEHNARENTITISVEFPDPAAAARMAGYFLTMLNDHMTSEAKRVAKTNMKYLEGEVGKTADPFIKQKLYVMIAQQIETSMMAEAKENFAFKVIDPPKEPDKKFKPKRALMVAKAFVVSLFAGVFILFFVEYLKKVRANA
ncbi:MAG: hypothetical protein NTY64_21895, partial [Deltaproteobacteria bacterium]|nr:hypothetical protein [Deltaproteobacteria bacterium]